MTRSLPFPDLTKFTLPDRAALERLTAAIPAVDLDALPRPTLPAVDLSAIGRFVEDAAYITIGLGVLGVQRLQVRRREFGRAVSNLRNS